MRKYDEGNLKKVHASRLFCAIIELLQMSRLPERGSL